VCIDKLVYMVMLSLTYPVHCDRMRMSILLRIQGVLQSSGVESC